MVAAKANPNAIRGCGDSRKQGGVYLECGLAPGGKPVENFLFDPPKPYRAEVKRGVQIVEIGGVNHVIDYVGESSYPYPSDILEEVRLHGLSRLVSPEVIKGQLSSSSKVLLVHAKAILVNAAEVDPYLENQRLRGRCAQYLATGSLEHLQNGWAKPAPGRPCTRHSYALAEATRAESLGQRALFIRELTPHVIYPVEPVMPGAPAPQWESGIIAALPITNISVVAADDGSHTQTIDDLRAALPDLNIEGSTR
jgi:hypothetical protein